MGFSKDAGRVIKATNAFVRKNKLVWLVLNKLLIPGNVNINLLFFDKSWSLLIADSNYCPVLFKFAFKLVGHENLY